MSYTWYDLVGNLGVALIIGAYLLLQLGRLRSDTIAYSLSNALGASGVLVSLAFDFNLSAFIIEAFWVVISLIGLARVRSRKGKGEREDSMEKVERVERVERG